jgi:hypothetical protein
VALILTAKVKCRPCAILRYKDVKDLVLAFQNGEELGYDKMSSGGMGEVRKNIARLPEADVTAIAEYVMSLN